MKSATSAPAPLTVTTPSRRARRHRHVGADAGRDPLDDLPWRRDLVVRVVGRPGDARPPPKRLATLATTRAGEKPTPSSPRSPSETTWNSTCSRSRPGTRCLELAQRSPLRLADGLAGRLDGHGGLVAHRRGRPPPRLRLTRRGSPLELGRRACRPVGRLAVRRDERRRLLGQASGWSASAARPASA